MSKIEMNKFEKDALEILKKKDKEFDEKFEKIFYFLLITLLPIPFFFYSSTEPIDRAIVVAITLFFVAIISVPLYFFLKPIMLRNDKEYIIVTEILENYEKKRKKEEAKEMLNKEIENSEKINGLEKYAKNLKKDNKDEENNNAIIDYTD